MAVNSLTFLAQNPYASFQTRSGVFTADANGLISGVPIGGTAIKDLLSAGCAPIASNPSASYRNLLDGGDFTTNPWQRNCAGLATTNFNTTDIANTLTYFPDRWFGLGGASSAIKLGMVADTTVPGFSQSLFFRRTTSNADVVALNCGQVVEPGNVIKTQGQPITFSFWARTGALYSGGDLTVKVHAGTGIATNSTAALMCAGTWTGQSAIINATQTLSGSMTRYSFSGTVPKTATELGVQLSWTPSGTAGATDGIYLNGLQLEIGGLSPFEHRDVATELEKCLRYAWLIAEPADGTPIGPGVVNATNTELFCLQTPVTMYKAPTVTKADGTIKVASGGAFGAATTFAAGTLHTPNTISLTAANTATAGWGALLGGGGVAGGGYILASADF